LIFIIPNLTNVARPHRRKLHFLIQSTLHCF
jgi:hypothetical protein